MQIKIIIINQAVKNRPNRYVGTVNWSSATLIQLFLSFHRKWLSSSTLHSPYIHPSVRGHLWPNLFHPDGQATSDQQQAIGNRGGGPAERNQLALSTDHSLRTTIKPKQVCPVWIVKARDSLGFGPYCLIVPGHRAAAVPFKGLTW